MKSRIYIKWLEAYLDCKVQHGAMITGRQIYEILMKQYPAMTPSKSSLGKTRWSSNEIAGAMPKLRELYVPTGEKNEFDLNTYIVCNSEE